MQDIVSDSCSNLQMRKITAAQDKHQTSSLSVTTPDQGLQQLAGLSQQTFASAMRACKLRETSLEAAVDSFTPSGKLQTGTSLIDQISSTFDEEFDSGVVDGDAEAEAVIEGALQQLPEAEATVIHHVYGLQDGLPKSRPQVSCWLSFHASMDFLPTSSCDANAFTDMTLPTSNSLYLTAGQVLVSSCYVLDIDKVSCDKVLGQLIRFCLRLQPVSLVWSRVYVRAGCKTDGHGTPSHPQVRAAGTVYSSHAATR